jgi:hypothetical protein
MSIRPSGLPPVESPVDCNLFYYPILILTILPSADLGFDGFVWVVINALGSHLQ